MINAVATTASDTGVSLEIRPLWRLDRQSCAARRSRYRHCAFPRLPLVDDGLPRGAPSDREPRLTQVSVGRGDLSVPERVAMVLIGHKSRAIFDRYNIIHIIHEQELLDAGDQRVAHLGQQAQAAPARRRPHAAGTVSPSASCDAAPHKGARRARDPGRLDSTTGPVGR